MKLTWIEVAFARLENIVAIGGFNNQCWKFSHISTVDAECWTAYYIPIDSKSIGLMMEKDEEFMPSLNPTIVGDDDTLIHYEEGESIPA